MKLTVPESLQSERIDKGLALLLDISRSKAATLLSHGAVRIGGRTAELASLKLKSGDRLEIDEATLAELKAVLQPEADVEIDVVFEDSHLVVVNKAAGVVMHPGVGHERGTLAAGLLARFPELAQVAEYANAKHRPGIVHRLDKGTSGLLVVARTPEAYTALKAQLKDRDIKRQYLAVCAGVPPNPKGIVDAPIGRSERQPWKMEISTAGRPAYTRYEVLEAFRGGALLLCQLETGRTHQIRVHMEAIGHPIWGDTTYGWKSADSQLDAGSRTGSRAVPGSVSGASLSGLRADLLSGLRPMLHSWKLSFQHPDTLEDLRFSAPAPDDVEELLAELRRADGVASGGSDSS